MGSENQMVSQLSFLLLAPLALAVDFGDLGKVDGDTTYITAPPAQWSTLVPALQSGEEATNAIKWWDHVYESFLGLIPMEFMASVTGLATTDSALMSSLGEEITSIAATRNLSNAGVPGAASAFGGLAVGAMGAVAGIFLL